MEQLITNPNFELPLVVEGGKSVAAVITTFLPDYEPGRAVTVRRVEVLSPSGKVDAFFKLYEHSRHPWRFWLRSSKAQQEYANYKTFSRLGVPAAEAMAWGEERDSLGRVQRAFILTRAVPASCTLTEFMASHPPCDKRKKILQDLALAVRRLHDQHFYCYDLVWRNILVSQPEGHAPALFLIDCPRGGFARFGRRRRQLRDLASLDKSASQFCSRAERLRFLHWYMDEPHRNPEMENLARNCLAYRRQRWPEDWSPERAR